MQADIDHGDAPGLTSDERGELVRRRRENRTLRTEREILKEAPRSGSKYTVKVDRAPRESAPRLAA